LTADVKPDVTARRRRGVSRILWTWGRFAGTAIVLGVLVWRLGTGPFLEGVRKVDAGALAVAAGLGLLTTVCCAWRWKIVAGGLGLDLPLPAAVAAYYRALFLNLTLPGGVVGDVHRGVSHGRDTGDVSRALRAVAWERFAGQVALVALALVVLLVLPSPMQSSMPLVAVAILASVGCVLLAARVRPGDGRFARALATAAGDIRDGLLAGRAWLPIALASALFIIGHVFLFLIAARTAGVGAPPSRMLPLALLVMLVMVVPSVGGWGPREGAMAWAFGAAGLGAQQGVVTGVVYGLMVLVASLPGAAVLLVSWFRRRHRPRRTEPPLADGAVRA
jgi:uncharacterized membrane protein YbhN (UPF0104 family)